jgi:ABC-type nitrate/sulfonate/bicarbonate transport system permease component
MNVMTPPQSRGAYAGTMAALLGVWAALTHAFAVPALGRLGPAIDPLFLAAPQDVALALMEMFREPGFIVDVARTIGRLAGALTVASVVGVPLGLFFATHRGLYATIEGPMHALRSVPAAALFPLFLLVIGVGDLSLIALASYNSLMVVVINTAAGAFLANPRRVYQARLLGVSRMGLATHVLLWEALPHIFTGVRVAIGYALALIIAAEMFIGTSEHGLGRRIFDAQAGYRSAETYAAILIASVVGITANAVLGAFERRLLHWLPMSREREEGWSVARR